MKTHLSIDLVQKYNEISCGAAPYALVQINIKNFRYYNAEYGVAAGDEILHLVLNELQAFLSDGEYAGHLYADTFVLLLHCPDADSLLYDRLVPFVDKLYRIEDDRIFRNLLVSIGIYEISCGVSFGDALNRANLCRRESPSLNARNHCLEPYNEDSYARYMARMELETKTAEAYKNYEFVTYLQPKVNLKTGKISGAEALIRWFDENGNAVPLNSFLPILNKNKYISLLDIDMFEAMCRYLSERLKQNKPVVPISFNISKSYFYNENILADYCAVFEKYDIPKSLIEIEFMESISLHDTKRVKKVVHGFKSYGFSCALDDFGNGYSSFNVLLNADMDVIKMDRQFFLNNLNGDAALVIRTVVSLIHSLNMKVVAEGVELPEHVALLKDCGCDYVQGYYYHKPMPVPDFSALLDAGE